MDGDCAGTSALIGCADRPLGAAVGRRFAAAGASVLLAGSDEAALHAVATDCRRVAAAATDVEVAVFDPTAEAEVQTVVAKACRLRGRFASCVSGAELIVESRLDELSEAQWWRVLEVNAFSQFLMLKHAASAMRERDGGAFVALTSGAGELPLPLIGSHAIAQAAVELMVRVAADEMGEFGIRVNAARIAPPGLRPLGSAPMSSVDEAARAVIFLASRDGAAINGECVRVDGGSSLLGLPRDEPQRVASPAAAANGIRGATALVTGGATSIGLAAARVLAQDEARVLIVGRRADTLEDACASLRGEGLEVDWLSTDVTDDQQVRAAVQRAMAGSDRLDICVASAGVGSMGHLVDYEYERLQAPFRLNIVGTALTLRHASRAMGAGGSFVAVGSLSSVIPGRNLGAYGASKAGLDMLVRVAADELGSRGIRVNSVRPGLTRREAPSPIFTNPELMRLYSAGFPLVRAGDAHDSAYAIRYFAGPESAWTTGQCLTVDGGMSMRGRPDLTPIGER